MPFSLFLFETLKNQMTTNLEFFSPPFTLYPCSIICLFCSALSLIPIWTLCRTLFFSDGWPSMCQLLWPSYLRYASNQHRLLLTVSLPSTLNSLFFLWSTYHFSSCFSLLCSQLMLPGVVVFFLFSLYISFEISFQLSLTILIPK